MNRKLLALCSEHFYWTNRKIYYDIMKNFLNKKISAIEFENQFSQQWCFDRGQHALWERNLEDDETLMFEPDIRATEFEKLVSTIYSACDVFNPADEKLESHELNEEGLRIEVQDAFSKIEKYC